MFRWWRARRAPGVDGDNLPTDCTAYPQARRGAASPASRVRWVPWEAAAALGAHVCGRGADGLDHSPQADVSISNTYNLSAGSGGEWLRAAIEKSAIGRNVRGQLLEQRAARTHQFLTAGSSAPRHSPQTRRKVTESLIPVAGSVVWERRSTPASHPAAPLPPSSSSTTPTWRPAGPGVPSPGLGRRRSTRGRSQRCGRASRRRGRVGGEVNGGDDDMASKMPLLSALASRWRTRRVSAQQRKRRGFG